MLKNWKIAAALSVALASSGVAAETDVKVLRMWKAKCASCHGVDGKAQTETGTKLAIPDMSKADWQKKITDEQMKKSILDGVQRPGKKEGMDPFREKLAPDQIDSLIALIRGLAA